MKKMKLVLGIGACVAIVGIIYICVSLSMMPKGELSEYPAGNLGDIISDEGEYYMMAEANSEEEAKNIAELYGITFEGYLNGIGRYTTTKNPEDLFRLGDENGYPPLELSQKIVKYLKEGE